MVKEGSQADDHVLFRCLAVQLMCMQGEDQMIIWSLIQTIDYDIYNQ